MTKSRFEEILDGMVGKHVLVIGDVMLDEYVWGDVKRISPEAPVMVVEVREESSTPGGATNVVNNIQALDGVSSVIGVIGEDAAGQKLAEHLEKAGVFIGGLVTDFNRPTTRKTRIIAHNQQIVRVDRESRKKIGRSVLKKVMSLIEELLPAADIIVFSDYDKGMATSEIVRSIIESARKYKKVVVVNPKPRNAKHFKFANIITMNQSEAEAATGIYITSERQLLRAAKRLFSMLQPQNLLITRGPQGMALFGLNGEMEAIPAHLVEVYDVAGAGDTVVSVLALALAAGATVLEASVLANCAGGAVVRKVGVATVSREEIRSMLDCERRPME
ncbi:MAG: D-glycero-beta-D-manno-heptose-7-phosphate kinase [Armatimonadetes bacterium]|nr:D-glycero-beta-D-manno-heptose-7-phosphate kinase [Armatimonadota bacterium]